MDKRISVNELEGNVFFWYYYLCWFRGYDAENELNIDEALDVLKIDVEDLVNWEQFFFPPNTDDEVLRYIAEDLTEELSIHIQFRSNAIVFFLNDNYIGNLGGHFEAWFLTLEELKSFVKYPFVFLLLLPMLGIPAAQAQETRSLIEKHLTIIPILKDHASYIASCITNGLVMTNGFVRQNALGLTNDQNHSVRNINQYPSDKDDIIALNKILEQFVQKD
ncbi:Imm19 family immunity protein [Sphingobacterium sp. E70]|uniref:Imm19 family immunity protein n=1 Tax=Sphingobacterium sp. E70 TaxID=2853439 RepID=UPI00211BA4AC|nr:Imm19 family immunity protein [Sphingobacterium sp. E70]ULT24659.1 Imm19 family immunity protein [Sphingobacterium sp. E70]